MDGLKVVVIVSSDMSDIYFANQLKKQLNVVGILVEKEYEASRGIQKLGKALQLITKPRSLLQKIIDDLIVSDHYAVTQKIDQEQFGTESNQVNAENCRLIYTEAVNKINDKVYVNAIREMKPDVIAVSGSSILKEEILSIAPKGVLNLHGGLPQKYRGIWTTLWALFNEEPEYIGGTVHYMSKGIDDGDIIYQGRPAMVTSDNPETLYAKVVKLGIRMMIQAIKDIQNGDVVSYPQKTVGELYLTKWVTPVVLKQTWEKIERGIIPLYLQKKEERDQKVKEIMIGFFE